MNYLRLRMSSLPRILLIATCAPWLVLACRFPEHKSENLLDSTIRDLLYDREFGDQSVATAAKSGDATVELLESHFDRLKGIDYMQAGRLAAVLSSINTVRNKDYLKRICRTDATYFNDEKLTTPYSLKSDAYLPIAVSAYSLARLGVLDSPAAESGCIIKLVDGSYVPEEETNSANRVLGLGVLALGYTKDPSAIPIIEGGLDKIRYDAYPYTAIEAAAIGGFRDLTDPLMMLLEEWDESRYNDTFLFLNVDYGCRTFRALIALGEYRALDIFVEKMSTAGPNQKSMLLLMEGLTGITNLETVEDWTGWRNGVGTTFSISSEETQALKDEIETASIFYMRMYLNGRTFGGPPEFFSSLSSV